MRGRHRHGRGIVARGMLSTIIAVRATVTMAIPRRAGFVAGGGVVHPVVQDSTLPVAPSGLVPGGAAKIGVQGIAPVQERFRAMAQRVICGGAIQASPVPIIE